MANSNYVKHPSKGINLICIDPLNCRSTTAFSNTSLPVLYGVTETPLGFQSHDPLQCPAPRISYLESVESYWKQDFMQTFTDCLAASDFGVSVSSLLSISLQSFQGSIRAQAHSRYFASFSYQCCFLPSYYQAYVRGTKSTGYFNPIFSSQDDFNCVESEGCLGYGSMDSFYKATPHSVMWYLLHSMASTTLVSNGTSFTIHFWQSHTVGLTHTSQTIRATLTAQANSTLLGAPLIAFGNSLAATSDATLQRMIGNHYTLSLLTNQGSQQTGGIDQYSFMCPNSPLLYDTIAKNWYPTAVKDILNFPFLNNLPSTVNDKPINPQNFPRFFPSGVQYSSLISNTELMTLKVLECCTRDQVGLGSVTVNKFLSISNTGPISPQSYSSFLNNACQSMLCPNSPICHNILYNYCRYSESQTSAYCIKWNTWAALNYRSAFNDYNTSDAVLPYGAYATGVDTSIAAQMYACSQSKASNNTLTRFYNDMCVSLFSSTYQSNFPRLRTFHFGDPVIYLSQSTKLFNLVAKESTVNIVLTYTAYSFTQNTSVMESILGTRDSDAFVCMPMQLSRTLATFPLTSKDFLTSNFTIFTSTIYQLFNTKLIPYQGQFSFPSAPTELYQQTFSSRSNLRTFSIRPAYADFSTDRIAWTTNGLAVTHTTIVNETRSRFDILRQQDINYLYSISILTQANATGSGTSFQNSSADVYPGINTLMNSPLINPNPQGVVDSTYKKLSQVEALPTLTLQMNSNLLWAMGLSSNPSVVINPLRSGILAKGTFTQTFTNPLPTAPRSNINAVYGAVFSITNISPVTISSLTASVSSDKLFSVQVLDPSGNPTLTSQKLDYGVTFNTRSLAPQQSALCTVSQTFFIGSSDSSQPLYATPILFYDSFTNQTSLSALDFPVLGGVHAIRALVSTNGYLTPYTDNRFSTFVSDTTPINGISYFSNQNIYSNTSNLANYRPIDLTIFPLTGGY